MTLVIALREAHRALASIDRRELAIACAIVALSLAFRVTWGVYADREPQGLNDPVLYDMSAHLIAEGKGYTRFTGEPYAYYPVGYPATLGALYWVIDHTPIPDDDVLAGKMMNAVLGAATTLLVYLLGRRLFGHGIGAVAAFTHAAFPSQVFYTGTILSEPLFTFLLMLSLTFLVWEPPEPGRTPWLRLGVAGLLLGGATLTRAITLLFPFVLFAGWWVAHRRPKAAALHAGIVMAGVLAFAIPWSIRNTLAFDTPIMISTNAGDDLCIGHNEAATGAFILHGPCFDKYDYANTPPQEIEVARNRDGLREAVKFALTHPVDELDLIWRKAYYLLAVDSDGLYATESYFHDPFIPNNLQVPLGYWANLWYFTIAVWALLSLPLLFLGRDARKATLAIAMLYVLAIPLAFFGDPRFHFPAVPAMCIAASVGMVAVWRASKRWQSTAVAATPSWLRRGDLEPAGAAGG